MDDIEFYEKQVKFQENLGKIQQERSKLERQFFQMVRSNKKLQTFRATKLRTYWKEICERERRARERNETLLRDFTELEDRIRRIEAQSDKLEQTKKRYEDELTRLYPNWKQEIDVAKAQSQLKDLGFELTASSPSSRFSQPSPLPVYDPPPVAISSSVHPNTNVSMPKDALFKLVPYNAPDENFSSAQGQHKIPTDEMPLEVKDKSSVALDRSAVDKLLKSAESLPPTESAANDETDLTVPPLDLPTERSAVTERTAPASSTSQSTVFKPTSSPPQQDFISEKSSNSPTPVTPTHHNPSDANVVHRVEINTTKPHFALPSNSTTSDELDISTFSDVSEVLPQSKHEDPVRDFVTSVETRKESSPELVIKKRSAEPATSAESLQNLLSPKIAAPIEIPRHSVDSLPSESGTTETSHKTLPLTSSAAYQNMLKSNELSSTLGMSKYLDDDDDADQDELEKIVSPKGLAARYSEDDQGSSDPDTHQKSSPVYEVKTAIQPNSDAASSTKDQFKPRIYPPAKEKAPWDTDSEEDDSFDSRDVARGKKMDDDDFDFFD